MGPQGGGGTAAGGVSREVGREDEDQEPGGLDEHEPGEHHHQPPRLVGEEAIGERAGDGEADQPRDGGDSADDAARLRGQVVLLDVVEAREEPDRAGDGDERGGVPEPAQR